MRTSLCRSSDAVLKCLFCYIQVVLVTACMLVIIFAVPSSAHKGEDATTEQVSVFMAKPSIK